MVASKDLVFITSGGRTGTTFFGEKLSDIVEDCFSVHEPDLKYGWGDKRTWKNIKRFGVWYMVVGRALGLTGSMPTALRYLTDKITFQEAVLRVRTERAKYFENQKQQLIVEANLQLNAILPVLRGAFPNAKIVVISRDQETWVQSWMRLNNRHSENDPVNPLKRLTAVTLNDNEFAAKWPSMTTEEKLQWEWRFVDGKMQEFSKTDPLTKSFRYEDLFNPDGIAIREMLEFITTHGSRRYHYEFDPMMIKNRINAS